MPTDTTTQFEQAAFGSSTRQPPLTAGETLTVALTFGIGTLAYVLSVAFSQAVDWPAFMISFAPSLGLVVLGMYLRLRKNMPRAAMGAIASGIYIGFSGVITILIYLRFPFGAPMIDGTLMAMDAWLLGYDWATFTSALAAYPTFGKIIGWIYGTSLLQLFGVIFMLAYLGRSVDLQRVVITGIVSLLIAVALWWTWPSLGPSAYVVLPAKVESALGLVHGEAEGRRLMSMATDGNPIITPQIIMGTIAFPSYHTVMACLAVSFVWGTWLFWPMVLVNLGMLPAILAHGGHHATDMIGGLIVFIVALLIAIRLVPRRLS